MGGTPSAAGSNKKTYTILAYLFGWITGLIFLFVGKDDPDVKWNAANSVVVFGGLSIILVVVGLIPIVQILAIPLWIVAFIYWVIFMIQALQGTGQRIPAPGLSGFINNYVDQLANAVK
jgi:Predicted membrane protein